MSGYTGSCSEWFVLSENDRKENSDKTVIIENQTHKESNPISTIEELPVLIEKLELEASKNAKLIEKIESLKEQNTQLGDLNSSLLEGTLNKIRVTALLNINSSPYWLECYSQYIISSHNTQLEWENSSLRDKNNGIDSSRYSIDSNENEFVDFDPIYGIGTHCRQRIYSSTTKLIIYNLLMLNKIKRLKQTSKDNCIYCTSGLIPQTDKIEICHNKKSVGIYQTIFCDSAYVIYIAECKLCKLQAVGSTVNFNRRIAKYKRNISHRIGMALTQVTVLLSCFDVMSRDSFLCH